MTETVRLSEAHLEDVAEIERECFSKPWSADGLRLFTRENGVGFVLMCDGIVAAYGAMMTVLDEGQIANIATRKEFRRKGYGKKVVAALIEYGAEHGLAYIYLEVRKSNDSARRLYEALGFEYIGERKNFYSSPTENAMLMRYTV